MHLSVEADTPAQVLLDYLQERDLALPASYLTRALAVLVHTLMDTEVESLVEAGHYERHAARRTYRNGYRHRFWQTAAGEVSLHIPRLRRGSYYPHFITHPQFEQALIALALHAYIQVPDAAELHSYCEAAGLDSLSRRDVERLHFHLQDFVHQYQQRHLPDIYTCLFVDMLPLTLTLHGHPRQRQLVLLLGLREDGSTELLAHEITAAVDDVFWSAFLRRVERRGLRQVQWAVGRPFRGLRSALLRVWDGVHWQQGQPATWSGRPQHQGLVDAVSRLLLAQEENHYGPYMLHGLNHTLPDMLFMPAALRAAA